MTEEKKAEERNQKYLKKLDDLSGIEQKLLFTNTKIEELENKIAFFNLNPNFLKEIEELNNVKLNLNRLVTEVNKLKMRQTLITESLEELEGELTKIDSAQIAMLYKKAKTYISNLQVSFEDTVKFHNDLICEKQKYLAKDLPKIIKDIESLNLKIVIQTTLEKELTIKVNKNNIIDELNDLLKEQNVHHERKGNLETLKKQWEESNDRLSRIISDLDIVNKQIYSNDELLNNRIQNFNTYFPELSNKLYGEYYILKPEKKDKGYDLVVDHVESNTGSGKKKGQISAFDFAYIQFADNLDIKCLHFIMHDQVEIIHENQLNTLFEIANSINCQYILPILKDKIITVNEAETYNVLTLSQNDKLFRL